MGKVIRTVGIVLMLVVFPAMSWYYLSQGFDYRRAAFERVQPKEPWDANQFSALSNAVDLNGKTTVILTDKISIDFKKQFYNQYKDAYTFQLVTSDNSIEGSNVVLSDIDNIGLPGAILIDTSGQVRNIYEGKSESMTMLIEDTAIVMPRKPEIDIQLK
jgi:hypothetical protein